MIILDTHVLIWDALTPQRLSARARQVIAQANEEDGMMISDISLWEIAMLVEKGRVQVGVDCQVFLNLVLQANKIVVQAITPQIATLAVGLPAVVNKDPADRLILATAIANNIPLVTVDHNLRAAALIPTLW